MISANIDAELKISLFRSFVSSVGGIIEFGLLELGSLVDVNAWELVSSVIDGSVKNDEEIAFEYEGDKVREEVGCVVVRGHERVS